MSHLEKKLNQRGNRFLRLKKPLAKRKTPKKKRRHQMDTDGAEELAETRCAWREETTAAKNGKQLTQRKAESS